MTAKELRTIIGDNIRHRRKALGMTQQELADRVGISQPSITTIERGSNSPQIETLSLIADALGASPDLFLREDVFSETHA